MHGLAQAANASSRSKKSVFADTAARVRSTTPLTTSLFNLAGGTTPIGVQDDLNNPEDAFGAVATDGLRFLPVYLSNQPQGTLVFDLTSSATPFGFSITDVGEVSAAINLRTNTGAHANGITVSTFPPGFGNGNVQFYGLTQDQPFSRVFLTVTGNDDAYGLDKIYVTTAVSAVPGAAAALLMAAGLGASL